MIGFATWLRSDDDNDDDSLYIPLVIESPHEGPGLMEAVGNVVGSKLEFTKQLMQARQNYWSAYPDGPDVASLGKTYAELLQEKDYYYFVLKSSDLWMDGNDNDMMRRYGKGHAEMMDALTLPMDGGISKMTEGDFNSWVNTVNNTIHGTGSSFFNDEQLAASLTAGNKKYNQYVLRRNLVEYLLYCQTSPMKSDEPRQYFSYLALVAMKAKTMRQAQGQYDRFVKVLTKPVIDKAIAEIRDLPEVMNYSPLTSSDSTAPLNTLMNKIEDDCFAGDDDRLWTMAHFLPDPEMQLSEVERWEAAGKTYNTILQRDGANKIHEARLELQALQSQKLAEAHQEHPDPQPYPVTISRASWILINQRFKELLPAPEESHHEGPIQVVYNLADQTEKQYIQWTQLCEGSAGSLLGIRTAFNSVSPFEIVRLDLATKDVKVLIHIDKDTLGRRPRDLDYVPACGSLMFYNGWIYCSTGPMGRVFRLREDGRQFQVIDVYQGTINPSLRIGSYANEWYCPVICGIDDNGLLYGNDQGRAFVITKDGGKFVAVIHSDNSKSNKHNVTIDGRVFSLCQARNGRLYGVNAVDVGGDIFSINPDGGNLTTIFSFKSDPSVGYNPCSPLLLASDGLYYGLTSEGGKDKKGTIFEVTPDNGNLLTTSPATVNGNPSTESSNTRSYPSGIIIPASPGFVKSPYAPDQPPVDVRGYASGTKLRCPYTNKIFIIP